MAMTITEEQLEAAIRSCYESSFPGCKYDNRPSSPRTDEDRRAAMRAALATLGIEVEKPDPLKEVREVILEVATKYRSAHLSVLADAITSALKPYLKEKP